MATTEENISHHKLKDQSDLVREKQIVQYIPLVKYVVGRLFASIPSYVNREDMLQAGVVGLIQAVDQFDPDRSVRFESYAIPRIRGAILDSFRETDWAPRSIRQKAIAVEKAINYLEAELGRSPSESEVAARLGISLRAYQSQLEDMSAVRIFSLNHPFWQADDGSQFEPAAPEEETETWQDKTNREGTPTLVYETLTALPDRERLILILYYYENLTFKEIATVLGITESRISQLHSQALLKIRSNFKKGEFPG